MNIPNPKQCRYYFYIGAIMYLYLNEYIFKIFLSFYYKNRKKIDYYE